MIAQAEVIFPSARHVLYTSGTIEIYREPLPSNHDYGVDPPNGTSPSTFADGDVVLAGLVTSATVVGLSTGAGSVSIGVEYLDSEFTRAPGYFARQVEAPKGA